MNKRWIALIACVAGVGIAGCGGADAVESSDLTANAEAVDRCIRYLALDNSNTIDWSQTSANRTPSGAFVVTVTLRPYVDTAYPDLDKSVGFCRIDSDGISGDTPTKVTHPVSTRVPIPTN